MERCLTKDERITAIKTNKLFSKYDETILLELEPEFTELSLKKDALLFNTGEVSNNLYIVIQGRLNLFTTDSNNRQVLIDEKLPGMCIGEIGVLTGQHHTNSAQAQEDTLLLSLARERFSYLVRKQTGQLTSHNKNILSDLQIGQLEHILRDLFGTIDMAALHSLQTQMEWITLAKGETLFRQGEAGDAMYIVVTGRLQVSVKDSSGNAKLYNEIGSREIVGEMALLTQEARAASVTAIRDTELVKLTTPVFDQLIVQYPKLMMEITRIIVRRQQQMLKGKVETKRSFNYAIIPLSKDLPMKNLLAELAEAMGIFGSVLAMDATRFDQIYGMPNAAQTPYDDPLNLVLTKCLTDLDLRHQYLIYAADPDWTAWTQRCVSQADRVVLIANANDTTELRHVEEMMRDRCEGLCLELVLLHPPQTKQPQGTARWLASRKVALHHHICQDNSQHIRRLVRHLTNNTIGLVLSGGGARGFAHLGVLKALHELGIEIDTIGGTSMGSLMSAIHAVYFDPQELVKLTAKFASTKELLDYTIPFVSLMTSRKVNYVMNELFGDINIEDLWNHYFCISSNLSQAAPIVHRQGLLRRAVRASTAIPAVFSPVFFEGDVVVDGGLINNFPIDIMRDFCPGGTVIGVSVSPPSDKVESYTLEDSISGWELLWNRLNPLSERIAAPSLIWTMLRSLEVNSVYLQKHTDSLTDLLINPNVGKFGILDFDSYQPIIDIGYQAALPKLQQWQPTYQERYQKRHS